MIQLCSVRPLHKDYVYISTMHVIVDLCHIVERMHS